MMNIAIYQINRERDSNRVCFMNYEALPRFQGSQEPDPALYDKVYDGAVDCANLEGVYRVFNLEHPAEYRGHSLSVSDIVEVKKAPSTEPGFYFCDSVGFKPVPFEPVKAQERKADTIRVVLLEPGKLARVADIEASLEGMQRVVGGDIEGFYPFEEEVCIVCNDEGKISGMPLNRAVRDGKEIMDIIAGPCFICDCRTENFASLSDEQLQRFSKQYKYPERFFQVNDEIKAVPYKPNKEQER